ncbi:MAG: hypothetical protein M3N82_03810 [Pseudomonadota bacterium]|nr:hypothetical protein [Pseudomonadota bacterium]
MENSVPIVATSVIWHIVWQLVQGNDLTSPEVAGRIRARLLAVHRRPGRELLHYLLTPTEMHLLSRLPANESPSEVAPAVGNLVARWVRAERHASGAVLAGRFRAYSIESDDAARDELRMLAWRPVALGLCKAPTHHVTSSLRESLGLRRIDGFNILNPLRLFGPNFPENRSAMAASIARRPGVVDMRRWELTRGMVRAPGHAGPVSSVTRSVKGLAAALVAASQPPGIDGALLLLERWVLAKMGLHEGADLALPHSLAGARVHALVAILAVQLELCSASSVARHFRRAKATLSERMAASRREPKDQAILGLSLKRIVDEAIDLQASAGATPGEVNRPRTTR